MEVPISLLEESESDESVVELEEEEESVDEFPGITSISISIVYFPVSFSVSSVLS